MIFSVACVTPRCLPVLLAKAGKIDLRVCEISDYKVFDDDYKTLVLIGDGRKLKPRLDYLVRFYGRDLFDYVEVCHV